MRRLLILALAACAAAHESCCEKAEAEPEFIIDPDDAPPDVYEGEPRYVADPADTAPAAWDEDEDGPYERRLIENPRYAWAPREIENPRYRPPASLGERYADAVREAAPWVALGAIVAAVLDAAPMPSFAGGLKTPGAAGVVAGALVGLATPLCSCGVLPGAAALAAEGVPLGSVVAFLTAAQSSGLDSAAITYGLLGWRAALARLLGAVVLACAAGLAVGRSAATPRKESGQRRAPRRQAAQGLWTEEGRRLRRGRGPHGTRPCALRGLGPGLGREDRSAREDREQVARRGRRLARAQ